MSGSNRVLRDLNCSWYFMTPRARVSSTLLLTCCCERRQRPHYNTPEFQAAVSWPSSCVPRRLGVTGAGVSCLHDAALEAALVLRSGSLLSHAGPSSDFVSASILLVRAVTGDAGSHGGAESLRVPSDSVGLLEGFETSGGIVLFAVCFLRILGGRRFGCPWRHLL